MKQMLRKKILEKFKNLNPLKSKSLSNAIKNRLLTLSYFINSQKIGIYNSKDKEVDTKKIIKKYLIIKH